MQNIVLNKKFEDLSLSKKIDFLEDYDVANDIENRDYFIRFVKNTDISNNNWFLSLIVDLASDLQIKDDKLFKRYFEYLFKPVHYLLKLSILDFQLDTYHLYYPQKGELLIKLEEVLERKYERLIVRNQILLNLMVYHKEKRLIYQMQLIDNLAKTSDYRSHLRVYNTFMNYSFFDFITSDYISQIIPVTEKWKFGRSVTDKIIEAKSYW